MANLTGLNTNFFPTASETYENNLSASISALAATVPVNSANEYADGDVATITVDAGTVNEATFTGVKASTPARFTNCVWTEGNLGVGHASGATVVDYDSATHMSQVSKGILKEHKQNGQHGAVNAESITVAGAAAFNGSTSFNGLLQKNGVDVTQRGLYDNAIVNAGCQVGQRTAPTLTNAFQYGKVDRFAVKGSGTAVSAGTITQTATPLATLLGNALRVSGVTITGAGILHVRYRMEAKDALMFKNGAASFKCSVYHDVGSAVNYTIFIRKATVADNFTAVTDIANSGAVSVPNTTLTDIVFENINVGNLGDVSNGIEIEIQVACGAVTTKNFEFANFQFNKGSKAASFQPRTYHDDLSACLRYYYPVVINSSGYYSTVGSAYIGGGQSWIGIPLASPMRSTPTIGISSAGVRYGGADYSGGAVAITQQSPANLVMSIISTGTGNGNSGTGWVAPGGTLTFDSEL